MKVFGPVPSRRLGQSLGVNNIPPKTCSYSCVYCQIGRTNRLQITRRPFYEPRDLLAEIESRLNALRKANKQVDFITFVPDGEPTLDQNLGTEIRLLKQFGIKIAVITNASLIWMDEVKDDLMAADWVSLKVDAVDRELWRKIDRPHGNLDLGKIHAGIKEFARQFRGTLVTETMLVKGRNDTGENLGQVGAFLNLVQPAAAYLLTPTRPPAERGVEPVEKETLRASGLALSEIAGAPVKCIAAEDEANFFAADDVIGDLLSTMSVHPLREDILKAMLCEKKYGEETIQRMIDQDLIKEIVYESKKFYVRNLEK